MKQISDYVFYNSWQLNELDLIQRKEYFVVNDLCDLNKGTTICFAGFDDIDNHYGVFVFTDSKGAALEVSGDFSSPSHGRFIELKQALKNV